MPENKIYAVGLGPGSKDLMAPKALEILRSCNVIAGYKYYLEQFPDLFAGKTIISSGMTGEIQRCREALEAARSGKRVAVISSGDAGIYGMAGLLMELAEKDFPEIEVETVPGITAASAVGALLGAPLMNDFATISLSDLMTPEKVIIKRLEGVAEADLVCVLYNPASKKRRTLIRTAVDIYRRAVGEETVAGIVTDACRPDQQVMTCTLKDFPFDEIGMKTLVVLGNSRTVLRNGKMYTLRGYDDKYGI